MTNILSAIAYIGPSFDHCSNWSLTSTQSMDKHSGNYKVIYYIVAINDFEYDFDNLRTFYKMVIKILNLLIVSYKDFATRGRVWVSNYISRNIVVVMINPFSTYPILTSTSLYINCNLIPLTLAVYTMIFILDQRPTCIIVIFLYVRSPQNIHWAFPSIVCVWENILAYSICWYNPTVSTFLFYLH